ncbi:MAG TPA: PaaI family thioesterase, partial [Candidatus Deferrimicrobium sp.]|nr:PaaI family thioesterase [Candidatus Deferrimicrobium sp.]
LQVNYLRPVAPDGSLLHARATVAHRGRSLAVATAEIVDESGRRVAMATGSAQVLSGRSASLEAASPQP